MKINRLAYINKESTIFFMKSLYNKASASAYIKKRIPEEQRRVFRLGYSNHNGYLNFLNSKNISFKEAEWIGLLKKDKNGKHFPTFTNRIMFPIINAGIIVGFTGRTTIKDTPKYFSTTNTPYFKKEELLYGLWQNRISILKKGYCFLLEGYIDTITLHGNGIKNSVALAGTSLNLITAKILKRYANKVVVILDGDNPGILASKEAEKTLKLAGLKVKRVELESGYDPDEYLHKFGKEKFLKLCKEKVNK